MMVSAVDAHTPTGYDVPHQDGVSPVGLMYAHAFDSPGIIDTVSPSTSLERAAPRFSPSSSAVPPGTLSRACAHVGSPPSVVPNTERSRTSAGATVTEPPLFVLGNADDAGDDAASATHVAAIPQQPKTEPATMLDRPLKYLLIPIVNDSLALAFSRSSLRLAIGCATVVPAPDLAIFFMPIPCLCGPAIRIRFFE